jgi:ribonuclease P protein component
MAAATFEGPVGLLKQKSPKGGIDEAHIPAESSASSTRAWLSEPREESSGPRDSQATAREGTSTACCSGAVEVGVGIQTERFRRTDRLVRPEEFTYVLRYGRRVHNGAFVMVVADQAAQCRERGTRLGITVSRRVGKAIVRNRVKRRIREWFRHKRPLLKQNLDIVVIAQRAAARLSGRETVRALEEGARLAGVVA